jgi:hypothetical protein
MEHCDSQPLALFNLDRLQNHFGSYSLAIRYLVLAAGIQFCETRLVTDEHKRLAAKSLNEARRIVFGDILCGDPRFSTLQALCLSIAHDLGSKSKSNLWEIGPVDFAVGNLQHARLHTSIGAALYQSLQLAAESDTLSRIELEERRRCYWSIYLHACLTNRDPKPIFSASRNRPPFPPSLTVDLQFCISLPPSTSGSPFDQGKNSEDLGITGYALQLAELWQTSLQYVANSSSSSEAPWTTNSTHFQIVQRIRETESCFCKNHKNAHARFGELRVDDVESNSRYWRPWLWLQFAYHAMYCLLYHPFVHHGNMKGAATAATAAFLEQSSDLALLHAKHIVPQIDVLEEKAIRVSDPFLCYVAAIASTVLIWCGHGGNGTGNQRLQLRYAKCREFILGLAKPCPVTKDLVRHRFRPFFSAANTHRPKRLPLSVSGPPVGMLKQDQPTRRFKSPRKTGNSYGGFYGTIPKPGYESRNRHGEAQRLCQRMVQMISAQSLFRWNRARSSTASHQTNPSLKGTRIS